MDTGWFVLCHPTSRKKERIKSIFKGHNVFNLKAVFSSQRARIYFYKMKSLQDVINTDNILTMFTEAEAPVFWPPDAKSQLTRP